MHSCAYKKRYGRSPEFDKDQKIPFQLRTIELNFQEDQKQDAWSLNTNMGRENGAVGKELDLGSPSISG